MTYLITLQIASGLRLQLKFTSSLGPRDACTKARTKLRPTYGKIKILGVSQI